MYTSARLISEILQLHMFECYINNEREINGLCNMQPFVGICEANIVMQSQKEIYIEVT